MTGFQGTTRLTDRWEHLSVAVADGVVTITFNRPDKLGALTFAAYADLRDLLGEVSRREGARVIVVTGSGRGFCSGGDVEEIIGALRGMEVAQLLEFTRMTGSVVRAMRECPLPIIAGVNGVAAGAGAVIALAADVRLLARSASFAFLFTRVGLSGADMGSAYLLPRIVGLGRATELLIFGERVDAERAEAIGLASGVVDDAQLGGAVREAAMRIAQGPALAMSATKSLLTRELDMDLGGALEMDAMTQALLMRSRDHDEFYRAWSEGRSPQWSGR